MKQLFALIVLVAVLRPVQQPAGEPPAAQSTPAERGMVGVLRRDGLILPFAAFRGTSWSTPWPAGLQYLELPVNVEAIPERWWGGAVDEGDPAPKWTAWLTNGRGAPIALTGIQLLRVHCDSRMALRSDHQPADPMPLVPEEPFPKDGLAVTAGAAVERVEIVPASDPSGAGLIAAILDDLNRIEDREVGLVAGTGWRHPVARREREKLPIKLESWYRTTLPDGTLVSYIEAVRSYPTRPEDDGCGLETLFSGWVLQQKGRKEPRVQLGSRITYCDRVGATYMLPFGTMRLRDRMFWISQLSGRATEWYAVTELGRDRVRGVVQYPGGGC
ncbi:MAG TPA: hypothetical protein VFS23_23600 [Vicinamibacterales bacterium]|nr:hypothetical protein [Vicinamibacterales bacterium]